MESIIISDNQKRTSLALSNDKIDCFCFDSYTNNNILDYALLFRLSNNYTIIDKQKDTTIVIDNNTGLKHCLINGIDNIEWLFLNNGYECASFLGNNHTNNNHKRIFNLGKIIIICSLSGLIMFNSVFNIGVMPMVNSVVSADVKDLSLGDLHNFIYSSPNLTIEEKDYLYNEEFLGDILELLNSSNYLKYKTFNCFHDIDIKPYDEKNGVKGYYLFDTPNILYLKKYEELNPDSKDVLAHEFVHLCQDVSGYNFIIEACAEIISTEYYEDTEVDAYTRQGKLIKILMEIIGTYPIWYYNFTGDFSLIEERTKPYFTNSEYKEFIRCLTFTDELDIREKCVNLYELLSILYKNIYNDDIENNQCISLLNSEDRTLVRYYFNKRLMSPENSYYYNHDEKEYVDFNYEEAIERGKLSICAVSKHPISYEEAKELFNTDTVLYREIDYTSANITILRETASTKLVITCIINGERFDNVSVDELVDGGYIKVKYYIVEIRYLTYEEYLNFEDDGITNIHLVTGPNTTLNDDSVTCLFYKKVYLPLVEDTIQNKKTSLVKKLN